MSKRKFTEEQIVRMLKEYGSGVKVRELSRKYGFSENTFYTWKNKYGGMEVSEVRKMKALAEENRRLKQIVAELTLDVQALKAINEKNW